MIPCGDLLYIYKSLYTETKWLLENQKPVALYYWTIELQHRVELGKWRCIVRRDDSLANAQDGESNGGYTLGNHGKVASDEIVCIESTQAQYLGN